MSHAINDVDGFPVRSDRGGRRPMFRRNRVVQHCSNGHGKVLAGSSLPGLAFWAARTHLYRLLVQTSSFKAMRVIGKWMKHYNEERTHSNFTGDRTPMETYNQRLAA